MAKCIIRGNNIYTMQMQAFGRQNPRYATNVGKHAGICKKYRIKVGTFFLFFLLWKGRGGKAAQKGCKNSF